MTAQEFIQEKIDLRHGKGTVIHNQHYTGSQWLEKMEEYKNLHCLPINLENEELLRVINFAVEQLGEKTVPNTAWILGRILEKMNNIKNNG